MRVKWSKSFACGLAAAAMFCALPAHADLVVNGNFETGDFTGWTTSALDPIYDGVDVLAPQAGTYAAFFGNSGVSTINQTLATQAGRTYKVSFWLMNEADALDVADPNSFAFSWGGTTVFALTNAPAFAYQEYNFLLDATGASTDLSFAFHQPVAFWDFDSVDVQIPEPGGLALASLGGALALLMSRRRWGCASAHATA